MAKKVTLSVPEELYEKMNKWRSTINFSKVFQNTMKTLISSKENLNQKINEEFDLSEITKRLKQEKEDFENRYKDLGKKFGLEWLKSAHYSDILHALKLNPDKDPTKDEKLGNYFSFILLNDNFLKTKEILSNNEILSKFVSGWIESINQFWLEVKEKI